MITSLRYFVRDKRTGAATGFSLNRYFPSTTDSRARVGGHAAHQRLEDSASRCERLGHFFRSGLSGFAWIAELPGVLTERHGLIDTLAQ